MGLDGAEGWRPRRQYEVDFRTANAVATRVDQHKRWKEHLDIEPGRTRPKPRVATVRVTPVAGRLHAYAGVQAVSGLGNPSESLDPRRADSGSPMQAEAPQHKNFGQRVVSKDPARLDVEGHHQYLLTPTQGAAQFRVPEYLVRKPAPKAFSNTFGWSIRYGFHRGP